ncbi:2-succinyl-5-enolpyruvyl-6-hydroxy-3-cyclohexene-1-carboxylic-acid synthase [Bacillus marinisedimentorum]|uniref:2-succinyl-5-enolpyruvyl-6-hydroxy-3- cyclohexene-1-carboxylic-acid synthase n=1 Tax=Bacillus marinisedimentorum TaxID=1821260 RepID=UPI00087220A1|nr:2-succinyl-5-enolpyruvyl-6-hydroxy-3-cyclohexene-1-carboxylic-acid synthase [Bacillus marinisedimentorum]
MTTANNALTRYTAAFVDELVNSGVVDAVISPGSRSTPMAMTMAHHPGMNVWLEIDERSAGFFALGKAKASARPVALVCTSGTAAANYMPAVVEAYLSRVPLLVLTTDRPHELRDVGAPQAIDQLNLYGKYAKWFAEMALPEESDAMLRYARSFAGRAAATAKQGPAGVVHMNFPYREPLIPDFTIDHLWEGGRMNRDAYIVISPGIKTADQALLRKLGAELAGIENGLIVCGPNEDQGFEDAVAGLADKLQYPVLADPLSQLRSGEHNKKWIIDGYDAFLRSEKIKKKAKPDIIIRFGAMPVSKPFLLYLKTHPETRQIIIDEDGGWREPTLLASDMIHSNAGQFCDSLKEVLPQRDETDWARQWLNWNAETVSVLKASALNEKIFEGQLFRELQELMPEGSLLFVGNSMPVRDLDSFFFNTGQSIRTMANRGANGIDGIVSSALGAASVQAPMVLVIGDLSFYHDMNGLLASKLYKLNATIVVVNNDGGGIFSFLPQAQHSQHFEDLFGTPHGLDFKHAAELYKGEYCKVDSWSGFRTAVSEAVSFEGLNIIEVPTDRKDNVKQHKDVWRAVMEVVESGE